MILQAYAVSNKGTENEQRKLIYFGEDERMAKYRVRDAIASGFEYNATKVNLDRTQEVTHTELSEEEWPSLHCRFDSLDWKKTKFIASTWALCPWLSLWCKL